MSATEGDKMSWLNDRRAGWLIILLSAGYYTCYYHDVFASINSVMSSITGDTLKNYFTYAWHITHEEPLFHSAAMNYPYGEHVVFTDCQPLLTFILRCLPFTFPYLVGILHGLIFASYVVSPWFLLRLFRHTGMPVTESLLCAFALNVLAPQFAKINGGHHGLAYGFSIPACYYLLSVAVRSLRSSRIFLLAGYNAAFFFIHPYLGFGLSMVCVVTFALTMLKRGSIRRKMLALAITGLLPLVLFRVVMMLTDHHYGRTNEPYGYEALVENPATLLAPDFGPFQGMLESVAGEKVIHFEGHSYLGLFIILATIATLVMLYPLRSRMQAQPFFLFLLMASFLFLLFSFGYHNTLLHALGINLAAVNQFRAVCRFAWFFYYALPLAVLPPLLGSVRTLRGGVVLSRIIAFCFLLLNLLEGHSYVNRDRHAFWKFRNLLAAHQLTDGERLLIATMRSSGAQAILPLPIFHLGSEMYDRAGGDNSMIPSLMYSYHTGIPVISCWLSRTSIPETESVINLMNSYTRGGRAASLLNGKPVIVLQSRDALMADERRLLPFVKPFWNNDTLVAGTLTQEALLMPKTQGDMDTIRAGHKSDRFVWMPSGNGIPFKSDTSTGYHKFCELDSGMLAPGNYVASFHYHYSEKNYRSLACNFIIAEGCGKDYLWKHFVNVSQLSGIYAGFGVFEYRFSVQQGCRYEFMLKNNLGKPFRISDFMVRPESLTLYGVEEGTVSYNNFPVK